MRRCTQTLVALLVVIAVSSWGLAADNPLKIHFIDVGQGDCIVMQFPNGKTMMVDCGTLSRDVKPSTVASRVRTLLPRKYFPVNDKKSPVLDALVISHADADHYNLLPRVLRGVFVGEVYTVRDPNTTSWSEFDRTLRWLGPSNVTALKKDDYNVNAPKTLVTFGEVKVRVLAANVPKETDEGTAKNTATIVLLVSYDKFDILLSGDATFETETDMKKRCEAKLKERGVEVFKVGHHGSGGSTSDIWAGVVAPQAAVVCVSEKNSFGHPRKTAIENLETHTVSDKPHKFRWYLSRTRGKDVDDYREAIYSTATNSPIVIETDGTDFTISYKNGWSTRTFDAVAKVNGN